MANLKNVKGENLTVGTFSEEFSDKKLSFREFQERLSTLDLNDGEALLRETARCSNRCNGNDVSVEVKTLDTEGLLNPIVGDTAQSFRLQFRIEQ